MDENLKMIESLLEKANDYAKATMELFRLKTIDKISEAISVSIPYILIMVMALSSLLFISLGLAFLIGEILNSVSLGLFAVGAFYGITGVLFYFLGFKRIKRIVGNYIVKHIS